MPGAKLVRPAAGASWPAAPARAHGPVFDVVPRCGDGVCFSADPSTPDSYRLMARSDSNRKCMGIVAPLRSGTQASCGRDSEPEEPRAYQNLGSPGIPSPDAHGRCRSSACPHRLAVIMPRAFPLRAVLRSVHPVIRLRLPAAQRHLSRTPIAARLPPGDPRPLMVLSNAYAPASSE